MTCNQAMTNSLRLATGLIILPVSSQSRSESGKHISPILLCSIRDSFLLVAVPCGVEIAHQQKQTSRLWLCREGKTQWELRSSKFLLVAKACSKLGLCMWKLGIHYSLKGPQLAKVLLLPRTPITLDF